MMTLSVRLQSAISFLSAVFGSTEKKLFVVQYLPVEYIDSAEK
jgi:hypothetical protein